MSDSFGHELGTVLICHKIQEHRFLITFLKSYLSTYPLVACGIWWRKKTGMMITTAMSVISGLAFGCLFGVVVFMFSCGRYGLSHSFSLCLVCLWVLSCWASKHLLTVTVWLLVNILYIFLSSHSGHSVTLHIQTAASVFHHQTGNVHSLSSTAVSCL